MVSARLETASDFDDHPSQDRRYNAGDCPDSADDATDRVDYFAWHDFCHDGPEVAGCVGFGGNRHHQEEKGYGDVISETGATRYISIICCLTTNFLYRSVRFGQPAND